MSVYAAETMDMPHEHMHGSTIPLESAPIDASDYASLQRGAKLFMNECSGCHSLKFTRYDALAKGIQITDDAGNILEKVVRDSLMFIGDKMSEPINTAMRNSDAQAWFGIAPPDLTMVARYRGADWVYNYLRAFYPDPNRPWGVNNKVYPDVAMPHVLYDLQQSLSPAEYDKAIGDLTNFLSYVAEPSQLERRSIGAWVLVFLGIFLVFSYLLKVEYWKDVKK